MLPYPGCLLDQPDGVLRRFSVIMNVMDENEREQMEKGNRKPPDIPGKQA